MAAASSALVPGISDGRRRFGRVVTGPAAQFATDLQTIFVPYPIPSPHPHRPLAIAAAGIALQASPTKDLLVDIDVDGLTPRHRRGLRLAEGAASLGWVTDRWPGFVADIRALAPELETARYDVDASTLLEEGERLARSGAPLYVPPILGAIPGIRPLSHRPSLVDHARARFNLPGMRRNRKRKRPGIPFTANRGEDAIEATPLTSERHEEPGTRQVRVGVLYPEWDHVRGAYRPNHVAVRETRAPRSSPDANRASPELVAWFRRSPDRSWHRRLEDGTDLDVTSYVEYRCDELARSATHPRFYAELRESDRDVATAVLLDASTSLFAPRALALELSCADALVRAMAETREQFAVFAFNGNTRHDVNVTVLRDFDEDADGGMTATVTPAGYTRLGAPIRHVTSRLLATPAERRILLSIGDGVPCDEDYEGEHADTDVARAVEEASDAGVVFHQICVGNTSPAALSRRFGPGGFEQISQLEALPGVLADVFERLRNQ